MPLPHMETEMWSDISRNRVLKLKHGYSDSAVLGYCPAITGCGFKSR